MAASSPCGGGATSTTDRVRSNGTTKKDEWSLFCSQLLRGRSPVLKDKLRNRPNAWTSMTSRRGEKSRSLLPKETAPAACKRYESDRGAKSSLSRKSRKDDATLLQRPCATSY